MKKLSKNSKLVLCIAISLIVMIIFISYLAIECIRGITGRTPLVILNIETIRSTTTTTEKTYGLIFSNYCSYSNGLSTGRVHRENKLFNLITVWEMGAN